MDDTARVVEYPHPRNADDNARIAKRNDAFLREVTYICAGMDPNLFVDYVFGLPVLGWARHSLIMLQRSSGPSRAELPIREMIEKENEIALVRAKPCKSPELDQMAWAKTKKEFENSIMLGPHYSLEKLPSGDAGF